MKRWKLVPLLVIGTGLLAYSNSFTGPFIFDDVPSIQENSTIRTLWPIWQPLSPPHRGGLTVEGRPLINLSLAINYALGGYRVWGYHALNLTVHILAGLTLLGVVRRTLLAPTLVSGFGAAANGLALATAVLWTVHPLQTESVTYIVQRAESIMGLFYLLTLYCFIRGTASPLVARSTRDEPVPRPWYGLCLAACALGMASKEVMGSAPLILLLYDRTFVSGSFREAWRRRQPLYLALAGTWILLGYLLIFAGSFNNALTNARAGGFDPWGYLVTEPGVILHYLRLSVWPHPLCLDYFGWPTAKTWISILPPALVLAILLGATAWACKTNSAWGFLGAWFFLILAPSSSFMPLDSPAFEHRLYLSSAAVVSVVVMGLYLLAGRKSLVLFLVAAIGLGFLTWRRNQDYRSELSIWQDTVVKRPDNPRAQSSVGVALARLGSVQEAIGHFEEALRLKPDYADAHSNLGNALVTVGRVPEAIGHCLQALRLKPEFAQAHYSLGIALEKAGRVSEAVEHYVQALRIRPDYAEAHNNLGVVLWRTGRVPEAIGQYQQALWIKPDDAEAHNNLGNALFQAGRVPEAIAHWEQALRIKPDYAEAQNNWGLAMEQNGKLDEAIAHYEQALRINPHYAKAHYNLGIALEKAGRVTEAIGHYEQALRIQPGMTAAQKRIARLQANQ